MIFPINRRALSRFAFALALFVPANVGADELSDFYRDRKLSVYVGYSAGGGYDVFARQLARHMGRFMPGNPTVVVQNMPGGGSIRLANWIYNAAPKDGTAIGAVARGIAFETLFGQPGAQFDAVKFGWIGSMNDEVSVCVAWQGTGVETFADLYKKEFVVGGTASGDTDQFPRVLNGIMGTKFRVVLGYPGGTDINLAMERGEVMGRCGLSWTSMVTTRADWLKDRKVSVLVQLSLSKHADLPHVPLVTDLARNDEERAMMKLVFARQVMGRPFMAPPGLPSDRLSALRKAFMETQKDQQFLEEANKAKLEINPVPGERIQDIVREAYETPAAIVERVSQLLK